MKQIWLAIIMLISIPSLFAQWECRSKLGAHLKPIGESNFMWASEITSSEGYLSNSYLYNGMGFLGLDYSTPRQSFYLEGGIKYWRKNDLDNGIDNRKVRLGFREAFYSYRANDVRLMLGLFSSSLKDFFLVNERILGINYDYSKSNWALQFSAGTVSRMFSRNGNFCTNTYLYDIIPNRSLPVLGNALGERNLAALTFNYYPGKKKEEEKPTESLSDDEFEMFNDEFTAIPESKNKLLDVKMVGFTLYNEFDGFINKLTLFTGPFVNIELPGGIVLKPEVLMQTNKLGTGIISNINLEKNIFWLNSHRSSIVASYFGFHSKNKDLTALNSYSNLFAGEVLRLDAPELPIYLLAIKHNIPSVKTHFKMQYARSNFAESMQEFDVQIGKTFFNQLLINAILGYLKSDLLPLREEAYLARCEIRFSF